jgi:acid phosphatase type 7
VRYQLLTAGACAAFVGILTAGFVSWTPALPDDWLYSTHVTSGAATIVSTMRDATTVVCRDRDGNRVSGIVERGGELRVARVTGLGSARAHRCRVLGGRPQASQRLRFRTPPIEGVPFRFAVVGDTGDGSPHARALVRVILASDPELLVHLGDLAYPEGTVDQLAARFFGPYRELLDRMPILPTPGNHDLESPDTYRRAFAPVADVEDAGGPRTVVDRPAALLVAMSSGEIVAHPGAVAWVRTVLSGPPPDRWRIALLHEPLYAPPQPKWVTPGLRGTLGPLFEAARVDVVLAGHQHLYARSEPSCADVPEARTVHVISGGGGSKIDQPLARHPAFPVIEPTTHFVLVDVTPETLELRAIDLHGETIDHLRLERGGTSSCRATGWTRTRERGR